MKPWKTLALSMVAITVLFNVLLLREMPDGSAGSIRPVRTSATDTSHSSNIRKGESVSRRLGSANLRGSIQISKPGLLKRWILRGSEAADSGATDSSPLSSDTIADRTVPRGQSGEEKYASHPHFAGRSPVVPDAQQSSASTVSTPDGRRGGNSAPGVVQSVAAAEENSAGTVNASGLIAELKEELIERPARLESLSEAFAQRQEIIAAVAETNGSADAMVVSEALPLAVNVSQGLDITKNASAGDEQLPQPQQKSLVNTGEHGEADGAPSLGTGDTTAVQPDKDGNSTLATGSGSGETSASEEKLPGSCVDLEEGCNEWAAEDGCIHHGPSFMFERCRRSCFVCGRPSLTDVTETVRLLSAASFAQLRSVVLKSCVAQEELVILNNGVVMPRVGFGTAGLGPATEEATGWALASGYRLLDSAQAQEWYREDLVGLALLKSGVPREQVFLTSKLHPRHHGRNEAMIQFTKSLSGLAVEEVDMFLLHYPACWPGLCGEGFTPKGTWHDSWRALEDLMDKGLVRAIGVSNFGIDELAELLAMARIKPALVQRHSDPLAADAEVQAFCRIAGIQYQGYSTLGSQWLATGMDENPVLTHAAVERIASETGRDAAQVVLRWALQHGQAIVPRSSKKERIAENRALDFVLSADQMQRIDALDGTLQLPTAR